MKILVVADRPAIAEGVAAALETAIPGVVTGHLADGGSAVLRELGRVRPDLVVADLVLPVSAYRALCGQVRARGVPAVCVVADAAEGLELVRAPADGIVTPTEGFDGLIRAVRTVLDGHVYVAPALLTDVLHGLLEQGTTAVDAPWEGIRNLTEREREVLLLLRDGSDVSSIANDLCISPETAKTHIRHVLHKLGVRSRVEAAAIAVEAGLVGNETRP